jgi:hypothetical protein
MLITNWVSSRLGAKKTLIAGLILIVVSLDATDTRAAPAAKACLMSFASYCAYARCSQLGRGSEPTGSVGIPVAVLGS